MSHRPEIAQTMLAQLRKQGRTVEWLAEHLGVPLPTMRRVASGDYQVRYGFFQKIKVWVASTQPPAAPRRVGRPPKVERLRPESPADAERRLKDTVYQRRRVQNLAETAKRIEAIENRIESEVTRRLHLEERVRVLEMRSQHQGGEKCSDSKPL